ncbi:MAG: hypothetical protein K0U45_02095, partial [Alphaproteobacteria bacterium]|nr:hypothetical protein [Alphaproteobacteria bacterium]
MARIEPETIRKAGKPDTVSCGFDDVLCHLSKAETALGKTVTIVDSDDLRETLNAIRKHSGDDNYNKFCKEFLDKLQKRYGIDYIYFDNAVIGNNEQYQQHTTNI